MNKCLQCRHSFSPVKALDAETVHKQIVNNYSEVVRVDYNGVMYPVQHIQLICECWVWFCDQNYQKDVELTRDQIRQIYFSQGPSTTSIIRQIGDELEIKLPNRKWGAVHNILDNGCETIVYVKDAERHLHRQKAGTYQ